jgi:hypothetical protein
MNFRRLFILICIIPFIHAGCLVKTNAAIHEYFKEIHLAIDTGKYSYPHDSIVYLGTPHLFFEYDDETEDCEVKLYLNDQSDYKHLNLQLIPSGDYDIIDSLINVNSRFYRFKVRFNKLSQSSFLKFSFKMRSKNDTNGCIEVLPLFPFTRTRVKMAPLDDKLYIGEEKVVELSTNNMHNIIPVKIWKSQDGIDYRVTKEFGKLRLHLLPKSLGKKLLDINIQTHKPFITEDKQLIYNYPSISRNITIHESRLKFLPLNKEDITLNKRTRREGIEVQIQDHYLLKINKTYRIEDAEQPGGVLIGELFTKTKLANNRVLCRLNVYNYHRKSEGYLYIKEWDKAKFITNFDVTPKTSIQKISILRPGEEWTSSLKVHPGETIEVKIVGQGLHKAAFRFEDVKDFYRDSVLHSSTISKYTFTVPLNFNKNKISVFNHNQPTGYAISVEEYQSPREFDYMYIDYGGMAHRVSGIRGPLFYDKIIKDITFTFHEDKIDSKTSLFGKQYLSFKVRITDKHGDLVEMRTIDDVVICPGSESPRARFYDDHNCKTTDLHLNNTLNRKTYNLEEWSKIEIIVSHQKDHYGGEGKTKKIEIYLQRHYNFDIDVSFPAGLLINKQGEAGYGSFGGISLAMIAQFSFYHPDKINKYRPYKVGAGFLAFNAFNFEANTGRDVGAVLLGSLYPTSKENKLTFPLYLGGGYFLEEGKWFYLIGPGIRVKL